MDNRKVIIDPHNNLLSFEEHFYHLQDVEEPNTYRNIFPYEEVPKIVFNQRVVPMNVPDEIWITDTTFRDGQQSRAPYTPEQIVTIYDYLHKLGGPKGIIRQSEFFLYSEKDRKAVELCLEKGYDFPEVTSWIRANKKDFELVKAMGIKETGVLVSLSLIHIWCGRPSVIIWLCTWPVWQVFRRACMSRPTWKARERYGSSFRLRCLLSGPISEQH